MTNIFILYYDYGNLNSILGTFTSGKKLANAVPQIDSDLLEDCMVKVVPVNSVRNTETGHDYQGMHLNEFLSTPFAKNDNEV